MSTETGIRLRRQREALHLTQEDVAEAAGIPQSHVSRIERGVHEPAPQTLTRLQAVLGLPSTPPADVWIRTQGPFWVRASDVAVVEPISSGLLLHLRHPLMRSGGEPPRWSLWVTSEDATAVMAQLDLDDLKPVAMENTEP